MTASDPPRIMMTQLWVQIATLISVIVGLIGFGAMAVNLGEYKAQIGVNSRVTISNMARIESLTDSITRLAIAVTELVGADQMSAQDRQRLHKEIDDIKVRLRDIERRPAAMMPEGKF
jgi:hypothetical protein